MEKTIVSAAADPSGSGGKYLDEVEGEEDADSDGHSRNVGDPSEDGIHWVGEKTRGGGGETADQKEEPIPTTEEAKPERGKGNRENSVAAVGTGKLETRPEEKGQRNEV